MQGKTELQSFIKHLLYASIVERWDCTWIEK